MKQNPISFQLKLNPEDFLPASEEEKESLVIMRESVSFWKDGFRRLAKNKVAMVSLVVILIVMIFSFIVPSFYPYSYKEQIKGANNLKPMQYSETELAAIEAGDPSDDGEQNFSSGRFDRYGDYFGDRFYLRLHCSLFRRMGGSGHDAYRGYYIYHTGYSVDRTFVFCIEGASGGADKPSRLWLDKNCRGKSDQYFYRICVVVLGRYGENGKKPGAYAQGKRICNGSEGIGSRQWKNY